MKSKLLVLVLMTAAFLFLVAALTLSPLEITDSIAFGTNLNKTLTSTLTFTNPDATDVTGAITASSFVYSSTLFTSTGLTISFDPSSLTIPAGSSNTTSASILVPYNAYMGAYTTTLTLNAETFPLKVVVKSSDYRKNLRIDEDDTTFPESVRVGSDFVMKANGNFIKNSASTDAPNVAVDAWLYDETDKKIVSKDSITLGTVKDGDEEEFDDDLELITDGLNSAHSYSLFIRAYSETDPSNYFAEEEIADIDLKSEEDLCDVGDLEVSDLDEDDIIFHGDKISPGEKITVPVTVENKGDSSIKDVVVRAWICEDDTACTDDDSHLDDYTISKLNAKTINEDDEATFEIPLSIDEDVDDGDYRLRVEAYEKGEDDNNCFGDDVSIEIEKEDEELIIEKVNLPSQLACGENFNVDVKLSNIGDEDLEDIIVKVFEQSTKLGINKNSDSFDLDSDDSKTESFSLKIPTSIAEGDYTFIVSVSNADEDSYMQKIKIAGNCAAISAPKTLITAVLTSEAIPGEQATIKATLTNQGTADATYTISISGNEAWSTSSIEPSSLTLKAGESKDVLISLDISTDAEGEKTFKIQATSAEQVTEQPVSLTIQAKQGFSITGSTILGNLKGNWFIWVIVAINVILIVAIIIVASKLSK